MYEKHTENTSVPANVTPREGVVDAGYEAISNTLPNNLSHQEICARIEQMKNGMLFKASAVLQKAVIDTYLTSETDLSNPEEKLDMYRYYANHAKKFNAVLDLDPDSENFTALQQRAAQHYGRNIGSALWKEASKDVPDRTQLQQLLLRGVQALEYMNRVGTAGILGEAARETLYEQSLRAQQILKQ